MTTTRLLIAASLILLGGCESVDSDDILTGGIFASLSAVAKNASATEVTARLKVGGATSNTYLDLSASDTLEGTVDGVTKTLARGADPFGSVWYDADFSGAAEDMEVGISFIRGGDATSDQSATRSRATLPAPFELTAPDSATELSRSADDLVITWDVFGKGEDLSLSVTGDCVSWDISEEDIADTGSFTVTAGLLVPDEDDGSSCLATVTLTRTREGTVDSNFGEGGVFFASQRREVDFTSKP